MHLNKSVTLIYKQNGNMQLKTYANMVPQPLAICIPFQKIRMLVR